MDRDRNLARLAGAADAGFVRLRSVKCGKLAGMSTAPIPVIASLAMAALPTVRGQSCRLTTDINTTPTARSSNPSGNRLDLPGGLYSQGMVISVRSGADLSMTNSVVTGLDDSGLGLSALYTKSGVVEYVNNTFDENLVEV